MVKSWVNSRQIPSAASVFGLRLGRRDIWETGSTLSSSQSEDELRPRTVARFATTHWSTVLAAGDSASPGSREALEKLCRTYWYPLYAFVRRKGNTPQWASGWV